MLGGLLGATTGPRNVGQPPGIGEKLAVAGEEAGIDEVVAFDAREGHRVSVGAEMSDALGIGYERQRRALPHAPSLRCGEPYL